MHSVFILLPVAGLTDTNLGIKSVCEFGCIVIVGTDYVCMYVCIRGGLLQPLHLDPKWSIVLNPYDR
jgi:hypothetical protein